MFGISLLFGAFPRVMHAVSYIFTPKRNSPFQIISQLWGNSLCQNLKNDSAITKLW
jgi:hypothetical protein